MQLRLLSWSRIAFLLGIAALILFIIPTAWFPLPLGKLAVFSLCATLATFLLIGAGGLRGFFIRPGAWLISTVWLLPLTYLLSWWLSLDRSAAWSGFSLESDTVLFVLLCAVAFSLSFLLIRSVHGARLFLRVLGIAAAVAALFQMVIIIFGQRAVPLALFSDRSVNVVGKWNDLGLLVGLLLILLIAWLASGTASVLKRTAGGILAALCVLLLGVVQFSLVWWLVLAGCVLVAGWSLAARGRSWMSAVWVPVLGALVAVVFLFGGAAFSSQVTSIFPVSSLEVRPSFTSTFSIAQAAHDSSTKDFLLGTGPGTFGEEWLLHKPMSVNQSLFWNDDFLAGFSMLSSAFESVGILGVLAWILPFFLALGALVRVRRSGTVPERATALTLALVAAYWWAVFALYVPSPPLVLLGFISAGASIAISMRMGRSPELVAVTHPGRARILRTAGALLCILFVLGVSYAVVQRSLAEAFVNQGTTLLSQSQPNSALAMAVRAEGIERVPDALRLETDAGYAELQTLSTVSSPTKEQQQAFLLLASSTVAAGESAVQAAPEDYRGYLSLAQVYGLLAILGISSNYQSAQQVYQIAALQNPTDPEVPLALAQLAANEGDVTTTQKYLAQSLALKPDYTDAILFEAQFDVSQKDIPDAILATQVAVKNSPTTASLWFELGLLYYNENDTADATPALERALTLEPGYANAEYFLGLSYAALGRTSDAIAQFQNLLTTNPNTAQVSLILNNLKAGKAPLSQ